MNPDSRVISTERVSSLTKDEEDKLLDELEDAENIYLEVCREEGENFTSMTTFHGMIRIFSSRTWTSLNFWVLVVCTCLVFYMIFCGKILTNYGKQTTFQRVSSLYITKRNARFSICGAGHASSSISPLVVTNNSYSACSEYSTRTRSNNFEVILSNISTTSGLYLTIEDHYQMPLKGGFSHFLRLDPTEIIRQNNSQHRCLHSWEELPWIASIPDESYSMRNCENSVRTYLLTHIGLDPKDFRCFPPCREVTHKATFSSMRNRLNRTLVFIKFSTHKTTLEETRKMTMTDVLSLLGGGTSLFLGCSCVTLMETFVFLFKLVVQAISKDMDDAVEQKSHMTTIAAKTSESVADMLLKKESKASSEPAKPKDLPKRRASMHPGLTVRFNNTVVDETGADVTKTHPKLARQVSEPEKLLSTDHSSQNPTLGEKLFMKPRFVRQQAVDIPDDVGDQNARTSSTSAFPLDDFSRVHSSRNILRRASTATSKASNTSRARSVKLISQVTPRRRSQIFSKHLVMNDF